MYARKIKYNMPIKHSRQHICFLGNVRRHYIWYFYDKHILWQMMKMTATNIHNSCLKNIWYIWVIFVEINDSPYHKNEVNMFPLPFWCIEIKKMCFDCSFVAYKQRKQFSTPVLVYLTQMILFWCIWHKWFHSTWYIKSSAR